MVLSEEACGGVGRIGGIHVYLLVGNRVLVSSLEAILGNSAKLADALCSVLLVPHPKGQYHEASRFSSPGRAPD